MKAKLNSEVILSQTRNDSTFLNHLKNRKRKESLLLMKISSITLATVILFMFFSLSAHAQIVIGTGTTTSNIWGPYHGATEDARFQYLISASELTAAGLPANDLITSIAFDVTSKNSTQPFSGFTIKMAHTSSNGFGFGDPFLSETFTIVYSGDFSTSGTGWSTHSFSTNFQWNGTDNIVIEICFDNNSTTASDYIHMTTSGIVPSSPVNKATGSGSGCSMSATGTGGWRPNMKFTHSNPTPCSTPSDQPTSLSLTNITHNSIDGSFTAAASNPDNYLVVASTSSSLSSNPINGTSYIVGDPLGGGTIVQAGSSTSFSATSLSDDTDYYFYIFSYNSACSGGPLYNTTTPLTGNETTSVAPPTCNYSIKLVDTYGDTWNGGSIDVFLQGVEIISDATVSAGDNGGDWKIINFTVNDGDEISTDYSSGSYASENEYYIYDAADAGGSEVYSSGTGGSTPGDLLSGTLSASCPLPCSTPTDQATALNLSPDYSQIDGSFTAASSSPDEYLVVISTSSSLSSNPVDGTSYSASDPLGGGTVVQAGSSTSFSATGLSMGTTYYFFVFSCNSACTGGPLYNVTSPLISSTTTLSCTVSSFPYSEDFDALTPNNGTVNCVSTVDLSSICWTNEGGDDTDWVARSNSTASSNTGPSSDHTSGGNYLFIEASSCYSKSAIMTSPTLDVSSMSVPTVSFWFHMYGSSMGTLTVDAYYDGSWNNSIWTLSGDQGNSWQEAVISIPGASGHSDLQIRFNGLTGSNYDSDIAIDDVSIIDIPCPDPTDLTASNITGSSAELSWTDNAGASLWDIELGTSGFTPTGTPTQSGVTNPYTYTSLSATTSYDYYVRANCGGGDYSNWVGPYNFTTLESCPDPSNLSASSITGSSAELSWTDNAGASLWDIELGAAGFTPTGTPTQSGVTNPYTYSGLTESSNYDYYVRVDCGAGDYSNWVGPFSFSTPCNEYTVPYFEGFESGYTDATEIGGCLIQESVLGTASWKANSSQTGYNRTPRTDSFNATLYYSNDDWIFIPISLTGGSTYKITLYARQDGSTSTNADITISYGTSATDAGMTNAIVAQTGIVNGDYQEISGEFTPASNGVYYVGILGSINASPWYISLDDISIIEYPTCVIPSDQASSLTTVPSYTQIDGSFTAATSSPDEYLIVASTSPSLSSDPTDGVIYSNGDPLGGGTVIQASNSTSFSHTGLAMGTTYYYYIFSYNALCSGGPVYNTDTPLNGMETTLTCTTSSFPYNQDFESLTIYPGSPSTCGLVYDLTPICWSNETGDDTDWIAYAGGTPTGNTGPSIDHTSETAGGQYLYVEGSCYSNKTAIMTSSTFDVSGQSYLELSFWYHMYGTNMGSLSIDAYYDGTWHNDIWTISGDQSNQWNNATVDLSAAAGFSDLKIRFVGTTGTYTTSDIAIDDVSIIELNPMTYVSSNCTQNTDFTFPSDNDHHIIGIEVVTTGSINPLDITEIDLNMLGSTATTDVSNIHVYYTGTNSDFSIGSLFGSTIPSSGTLNVTGSQTLSEGSNYFWVAYDIATNATPNNYVDAQCEQLTFSGPTGNVVPSETNPSGNCQILDIVSCEHRITLYDFENDGWGEYYTGSEFLDRSVDVLVDGTPVLTGLSLAAGDNGQSYTFEAEEGATISTAVNGAVSQMKYIITGGNGDFILEDGSNQSSPTGISGTASCDFENLFTLNGDAYFSGISGAKANSSGDEITLTSDIKTQKSSAWFNYMIDLEEDFEIAFTMNFGDNNSINGADGVVFALQSYCLSCGGTGSSIGYGGISPSVGIEFDTYYNASLSDYAPSGEWDHTAIFKNGSNDHAGTDVLASTVGLAQDASGNVGLTDGNDYTATVKWDATNNLLEMYWNGSSTPTISYSGDIVTDIFGGNNQVYWGFTSGTGAATNKHVVTIDTYPLITSTTQLQDVSIDQGNSHQAEVQDYAASYSWSPDDGSISDASVYNPTFTPTETTTYCCEILDDCGNTITDCFTINVNSLLPVELLSFNGNCNQNDIHFYWETASERNSDKFFLQQSPDSETWNDIASVYAAGESIELLEYKVSQKTDILSKGHYFRLKQVDFDGSYSLSDAIFIHCSDNIASISMYPNPTSQNVKIELKDMDATQVLIQVSNSLGQAVLDKQYDIQSNFECINLPTGQLKEGVYAVLILSKTNEVLYREILVKTEN